MESENIPKISNKPKIPRSGFLKLIPLVVTALAVNQGPGGDKSADQAFKEERVQLINHFLTLATGTINDFDSITSEVPPQLKDEDIPKENVWFRKAGLIFKEGLTIYDGWRLKNGFLPDLYYKEPENYLSIEKVARKLQAEFARYPSEGETVQRQLSFLEGVAERMFLMDAAFDIPYSSFVVGSSSGISSYETLIKNDPGTGFVKQLRELMKEKYGSSFDVWSACSTGTLTEGQRLMIAEEFRNWYKDALRYVQDIREKGQEPISTSGLFAYFLHKNKGDILASVWDTSIWLKVSARNDVYRNLELDPDYPKAKFLCELFKDEFSPHLSANWVIKHVDGNDKSLNHNESDDQWKDYMPPNRAGAFYHAWNIISLSLCMSPPLVPRVVAYYIASGASNYGRERCTADMLTAREAKEISNIVNL